MRLTAAFPFALLILFLLACNLSQLDSRDYRVTYKLDGTARTAHVTYTNQDGGTEMEDVTVPWEKTFTARRGHFLYISAQIGTQSGSLKAQIDVDGKQFKSAISHGAHNITSVHDSCCP
jgi:hypothetical protein